MVQTYVKSLGSGGSDEGEKVWMEARCGVWDRADRTKGKKFGWKRGAGFGSGRERHMAFVPIFAPQNPIK